ncbi:hypothetical protein ACHWQZ_G006949 [Mnemiopsis leidyi]
MEDVSAQRENIRQQKVDFHDVHHASSVLYSMNRLLNSEELTDVKIACGGETFSSSQLLLAANSEYFKAMFLNDFGESRERSVSIKEVDPQVLKTLIDFCSTSRITITQDNVYDIFNAANRFGFVSIEHTCCEFLKSTLSVENHLTLWNFGDERGATELVAWCDQFIRENILRILPTSVWLDYPLMLVQTVLGSDYLTIYNESQLFEGLMSWVKHDPGSRSSHLTELFACIRLEEISLKYLYHVISEEKMLLENEVCRNLINLVKDRRTLPLSLASVDRESKPARDTGCGSSLFIMGGLGADREPSRKFERFSLKDMSWQSIMSFSDAMWGSAAAVVEGYLLVSGGEGSETRNSLSVCNPAVLTENDGREVIWDELSPMTIARFGHGMVECMGWAYVVGQIARRIEEDLCGLGALDPRPSDYLRDILFVMVKFFPELTHKQEHNFPEDGA